VVEQKGQNLFFVDDFERQGASLAKVPQQIDGLDKNFRFRVDLFGRTFFHFRRIDFGIGRRRGRSPVVAVARQKGAQRCHHVLQRTKTIDNKCPFTSLTLTSIKKNSKR
jgi:hypothetical protein